MAIDVNHPPTNVTAAELDQMVRLAGDDSSVYQRLLEPLTEYMKWEAVRDEESPRLRHAREARLAVQAQERAAIRERERSLAIDALKERL